MMRHLFTVGCAAGKRRTSSRWMWGRRSVVLLLLAGACNGRMGCASCGGSFVYPDPPPAGGQLQPNGVVAQLEESGISFFAHHLSDILRANFPTRTVNGVERADIYLPESTVGSSVQLSIRDGCLGTTDPSQCPAADQTYRSRIELNLDTIDDAVNAEYVPGSTNQVQITLYDVDVFLDLGVAIRASGLGNATCWVHDDSDNQAAVHLQQLSFVLTFDIDPTDAMHISASNVSVTLGAFNDQSLLNWSVTPCDGSGACDDPSCHDAVLWPDFKCVALCGLSNFIFKTTQFLTNLLTPVIDWAAPPLMERAINDALAQVNGTPLDLSGRWDLQTLFAGSGTLSEAIPFPTQFEFGAHPNSQAFRISGPVGSRGMALSLDSATYAPQSSCVPTIAVPRTGQYIGAVPTFDGTIDITDPTDGTTHTETYDVAAMLSQAFTMQLAYTFYESGSMCVTLWPQDVERWSGGAFAPTLGNLAVFGADVSGLGPTNAPLMIQLQPSAAPQVHFGSGEVTGTNPDGTPIIDSLVQLDLGDIGLSVYTLIDNDMLRLTTIAAKVKAGLTIVRAPDNSLEFGVDNVSVTDVAQVYNELAPGTDFGALAQELINIAVGGFLNNIGSFNFDLAPVVSNILGGAPVYGRINAIRREGGTDTGYLTVYLTFCDQADLSDPSRPPCYTPPQPQSMLRAPEVEPVVLQGPAPAHLASRTALGPGRVQLDVDPTRAYQWHVDAAPWSGFRRAPDGTLTIDDPRLRLPGTHTITLRSRQPGRYWTRDATPTQVTVQIP